MNRLLTIAPIVFLTLSVVGQNSITKSKQSGTTPQNIVITQKTYNKISNRSLNRRKLSKIADKKSGQPRYADDPIARIQYETELLKNPSTGTIPPNIKKLEKKYVLSPESGLQNRLKTGGLNFTNSGPRNVGGRTRALAIDISDPTGNTILAGGTTGGMWRSTDNGESWTRTTNLEDHPSVTAIAQDPRPGHTSTWYYTTGEYRGSTGQEGSFYSGNGLFKSTNNGETWVQLASTAHNTLSVFDRFFDICWNICVDPNNGDVYVATYGAIYVSKDGGNNWSQDLISFGTSTNKKYSNYTDVICTLSGVKYASLSSGSDKNSGIWRKGTEANATWKKITPDNFPENYNRIVLAHAPSNTSSEIVYLLGQTSGSGLQNHSFWKLTYNSSIDYAWENRSLNLPKNSGGDRDVDGYKSQNSYNMVVKVAPDDENMVFIGGINLHRSDDAFATKSKTYWIGGYATENDVSQYPSHHPDVHALAFKNNSTLLCGHDGGISITSNFKRKTDPNTADRTNTPVAWSFLNNNYLTTQAYTIAIDHDNTQSTTLLSGFQDNGTWFAKNASANTNWFETGSGDGSYCSIFNSGNNALIASQNGTTYIRYDIANPNTYIGTRIDPEGAEGQLFINPFIVDANNSEIVYYAGGQYLWRNSNIFEIPKFEDQKATKNWEKWLISEAEGSISAIESSTYPAHVLYYGTTSGKVYRIENSHSSNATKKEITGSNMPVPVGEKAKPFVSCIDVNPLNANEVLVSFSNYGVESIFYSANGGTSWTPVSGNLEDGTASGNGPSVRSVAIMVSPNDTTYYAGTSTGLYSTTKLNGSSTVWTQQAKDQIGTTVVAMIKTRRDGFIAAGTHGNGIFTADADYSASAPIALIGLTRDTISIGESVDFMNRSIGDGITRWEWTFEGAETNNSSDEHPSNIVYNTPGVYSVSLRAVNSAGENTQQITAAIVVEAISAKFTASTTNISAGSRVNFTDQSSPAPSGWEWSFPGGDPEVSTDQNPTITYNTAGSYDVSLIVTNGTSSSIEIKKAYITVNAPVGIDDVSQKETVEHLQIYPNPMQEKTKIVFPNQNNKQYRLIVIDASGRVVQIIENITGNNVVINREQLKPGLHIINLSGENIYKGKLLVK